MNIFGSHRLFIIGDSITLGVTEISDSEIVSHVERTYVDELGERLPELELQTNAALHRTTTSALVDARPLLAEHNPAVVLYMIGGNDVDIDWKRFILSQGRILRHRVTPVDYEMNLSHLVHEAHRADACPILTDFPPGNLSMRVSYFSRLAGRDIWPIIQANGGEKEYNRRLCRHRDILVDVATREGVELVLYGEALEAHVPTCIYCSDGIHPNATAHRIIASLLAPAIQRACQIKGTIPDGTRHSS